MTLHIAVAMSLCFDIMPKLHFTLVSRRQTTIQVNLVDLYGSRVYVMTRGDNQSPFSRLFTLATSIP